MAGDTSLSKCRRTDTPIGSLSKLSRSRPTTAPHGRSVATWLTLILQCDWPIVGPGAFPHAPPRRGQRLRKTMSRTRPRMVDMSFPTSHHGIGEVGRDADELSGAGIPASEMA